MTLSKNLSYKTVSTDELHPYPDAPHIYANNFDIKDKKKLDKIEREFSSIRQAELISNLSKIPFDNICDHIYSFQSYLDIHKKLFNDIYPSWAGKIRSFDMGYYNHEFTKAAHIVHYGEQIFEDFKQKVINNFKDQAEFIKESARFLNLINILHPFPDGNGRTQRNIIGLHFNYHGFNFNWDKIHKWEIYETLKQSFEQNYEPLELLLESHLVKI